MTDAEVLEVFRELRYAIAAWSVAILSAFAPEATRAYVLWVLARRLRRVAVIKVQQLDAAEAAATLLEADWRGLLR